MYFCGHNGKVENWRGPLLFDQIETLIFLMH